MDTRVQLLPDTNLILRFVAPAGTWKAAEEAVALLKNYRQQMEPVAFTLAYAVLPDEAAFLVSLQDETTLFNHFKKEGRFPEENETMEGIRQLNKQLSAQQFNVYDKLIGKLLTGIARSGNKNVVLKKEMVMGDESLRDACVLIHRMPVEKGLCTEAGDWKYLSYPAVLSDAPTAILREEVLNLFGGREGFIQAHQPEHIKRISA